MSTVIRPSVSLAIVDTESYVLANNAISSSVDKFAFQAVHVFTDQTVYWPQYDCVSIPPIKTIEDYNRIILEKLPCHVQTDFCIVAQYDGFVLDKDAFVTDFYKFDYIGALWPHFNSFNMGNGGFSWRSKKLLDAVASLNHIRQPGVEEDFFICRELRMILEHRFGCVFADEATAKRFSFEVIAECAPTFGFHGVSNLPIIYRNNLSYLINHLPQRVLKNRLGSLRVGARYLNCEEREEFEALLEFAITKYKN